MSLVEPIASDREIIISLAEVVEKETSPINAPVNINLVDSVNSSDINESAEIVVRLTVSYLICCDFYLTFVAFPSTYSYLRLHRHMRRSFFLHYNTYGVC